MPWQSGNAVRTNGTYGGSQVWQDDASNGVLIRADRHDAHDQDVVDMVNECLHKGGENSLTANIDFGGFRILNLDDPVGAADGVNKGYVDTLDTAQTAYTDAREVAITSAYQSYTNSTVSALQITLSVVATTGDYTDLSNTPVLATVATSGAYSDLSGTPSLATVATSGDYNDLINTPVGGGGADRNLMYVDVRSAPQSGTSSWQAVTWSGGLIEVDSPVTIPNNSEFDITATGTYRVTGAITYDADAATTAAEGRVRVTRQVNGTGSFSQVGNAGYAQIVNGDKDTATVHCDVVFAATAGDHVRLERFAEITGGTSPSVSSAQMTIERID